MRLILLVSGRSRSTPRDSSSCSSGPKVRGYAAHHKGSLRLIACWVACQGCCGEPVKGAGMPGCTPPAPAAVHAVWASQQTKPTGRDNGCAAVELHAGGSRPLTSLDDSQRPGEPNSVTETRNSPPYSSSCSISPARELLVFNSPQACLVKASCSLTGRPGHGNDLGAIASFDASGRLMEHGACSPGTHSRGVLGTAGRQGGNSEGCAKFSRLGGTRTVTRENLSSDRAADLCHVPGTCQHADCSHSPATHPTHAFAAIQLGKGVSLQWATGGLLRPLTR